MNLTPEQEQNRAGWVEALRSGAYTQARSALRDDDRFCCLGVLCDLYLAATSNGEWAEAQELSLGSEVTIRRNRAFVLPVDNPGHPGWHYYEVETALGIPQGEVLTWVGLDYSEANSLAQSNDRGETFAEIADRIELNKFDEIEGMEG